ncbi:hypothetical protein [Dawidia soli]|uniref:PKD domain-containing protein n=1 Tax=Dawidia soli TaxID=2782352 RepID=A0AAP2DAD9_9BACT|nr:hypothetical protein [Dawidia soli]MBT1686985.1 hypothetical protein [Dawidia soli]
MKKTARFSIILVLAFLWQHCTDDPAPARPGTIRFALRPTVAASQGRMATSLPDGASLYVSIRREGGDDVYTLEPVRLLKLGEEYISEPLALPGGNYELTDFLVADAAGDAVYAAPKEASELAPWVDDPLPLAFTVSNNGIAQVDVEVLPTDVYQPAQFGYVTFTVEVMLVPRFRLAVFRAGDSSAEFARVYAYLLSEGDTLLQDYLPAAINDIEFSGSLAATYTLVLMKESYKTYMRTFVLADLLAELNGTPLQVTLEDALTFTASSRSPYFGFTMQTGRETTPFVIHWGDGTEEVLPPTTSGGETYLPQHTYAQPGQYHVSVAGDLAAVEYLSFTDTQSDRYSLRALPGLRSFSMANTTGADSVDLSHNPVLESLDVAYSDIRYFDIRNNPLIRWMSLEGNADFPVPVLDQIILDIHDHAFEQQIFNGEINLSAGPGQGIIGPPSPYPMDRLGHMGELSWTIYQ